MTVHARSDIAAVTISSAHGGCGATHNRPAPGGVPVALWSLDCSACEDFLRGDPLWASTIAEVPETHDEATRRTEMDKRGSKSRDNLIALALAKAVGMDADADLLAQIMGVPVTQGVTAQCPEGHENALTARFCATCGAPIPVPLPTSCSAGHENAPGSLFCVDCGKPLGALPVAQESAEAAPIPVAHGGGGGGGGGLPGDVQVTVKSADTATAGTGREPTNREIRDMKRADLVTLARSRGLPDTGSRADLIGRLLKRNGA